MGEIQTISNDYIPKMELRIFVDCLLSTDVMGNKDEAQRRTGISKGMFYYHLKHAKDRDQFTQWFIDQCRKILLSERGAVTLALVKKAKDGDIPGIRTFFELTGDLKGSGLNISANAAPGAKQPLIIVMPNSMNAEQKQSEIIDLVEKVPEQKPEAIESKPEASEAISDTTGVENNAG